MAKVVVDARVPYSLGVDLGTTYTAAAVSRASRLEGVPLGDRSPQVPSVVFRAPDGRLLFGEAAARHTITEPEQVAREFKRRLIDQRDIRLGEAQMSAADLSKSMLAWVVETVSASEGSPPDALTVSFPASWGPRSREVMNTVAAVGGQRTMGLCTEPEAAAFHFASTGRVAPGECVAIYDLGGGTFDVAIMRRGEDGRFEVVGSPSGLDQLGGLNFDSLMLNHVWQQLGWDDVDVDDPSLLSGLSRLRRDCVEAKEALSSETEVQIPVTLGPRSTSVRVTRSEFEELIFDDVAESVRWLEATITEAKLTPDELNAVVLVGGSARVPLVSQLVTQRLNRPVAVSSQPKLCVAMGAALIGTGAFAPPLAPVAAPAPARSTTRGASREVAVTSERSDRAAEPPAHGAELAPVAELERVEIERVEVPQLERAGRSRPADRVVELRTLDGERARDQGVRRRTLPVYRLLSLAFAVTALLLAAFMHQDPPRGVLLIGWDKNHLTAPDPIVQEGDLLQPEFLGLTPFDAVRAKNQQFDLGRNYNLLLAGPVKAEVKRGRETSPKILVPPPDSTVPRLATIPGAALILGALFSAAYIASLLQTIRRRGAKIKPGELAGMVVGMTGVGVVVGLVLVLAGWIFRAQLPSVTGAFFTVLTAAIAVGLLAFSGQQSVGRSPSR